MSEMNEIEQELSEYFEKFPRADGLKYARVPGTNGLLCKGDRYYMTTTHDLNEIKDFEIRDEDVFVIGFPKSGTTWIEELTWGICNDLDISQMLGVRHLDRVKVLDLTMSNIEDLKRQESTRFFKSHFHVDNFNDKIKTHKKVVYCIRNPKDVFVSFYHFFKKFADGTITGTFEQIAENFLEGKVQWGPWWKTVNEFTQLPNVHVIHFEDLVENPLEETRRLAEYLGKSYTDEQFKQLLQWATFDNMKVKSKEQFDELIQAGVCMEGMDFFRKGKVGDWVNHFSKEMSDRFDEVISKNLTYKRELNYGPAPQWDKN